MTRGEIIQQVEGLIERLDAHDELTASELRRDFDNIQQGMGLNALKSYAGIVETMLAPYEEV